MNVGEKNLYVAQQERAALGSPPQQVSHKRREPPRMRTLAILLTSALISMVLSPAWAQAPGPTPRGTGTSSVDIKDFRSMGEGGCIKDLSTVPVAAGDFGDHISFGPTVAAKAFNYDLASKRVAFNAGIGAGLSMRIYDTVRFYDNKGNKTESYGINRIRKKCRAETFDGAWLTPDNKKVIPLISISPMVFASKSERIDDIVVQPALTVGFFRRIGQPGCGV